ncbi:hypothetical protein FIBSPDRAFT_876434, partial [Athelia psychrophila]
MNHRPDTVARLQAKLDAVMPEPLAIPDITVPQNLPYLNTFIKEDIRVHGATPTLKKRVVPSPAANSSAFHESFDLMGYAPSSSPRLGPCTRDPAELLSPLPDRWLSAVEDQLGDAGAFHTLRHAIADLWGPGARDG